MFSKASGSQVCVDCVRACSSANSHPRSCRISTLDTRRLGAPRRARMVVRAAEGGSQGENKDSDVRADIKKVPNALERLAEKLGVGLGPIALSYQDGQEPKAASKEAGGIELGPIALSFAPDSSIVSDEAREDLKESGQGVAQQRGGRGSVMKKVSTKQWQSQNLKDGEVDLWLEDDYNAQSRLPGGLDTVAGGDTVNIENNALVGSSYDESVATYAIAITDPNTGKVYHIQSPEDRYILFEAEAQGVELQNACRNGCCTQCAVKVTKGDVYQPQALGISKELRDQGYALMCVAYADTDLELELADPDEVYQMQFGDAFAQGATDKNSSAVERDDFALELADCDE